MILNAKRVCAGFITTADGRVIKSTAAITLDTESYRKHETDKDGEDNPNVREL